MREPSFEEVLVSSFSYQLSNVYTALPAIVLTVHAGLEEQRIDVKPVVNQLARDGSSCEHPPILNVPVIFPASKTSAITFPISVGDNVLCIFTQRGIDSFKSGNGTPSNPVDFRRFDRRDAVAIPGLFPFTSAINKRANRRHNHSTADTVIAHSIGADNETEIRLSPDGSIALRGPGPVLIQSGTARIIADQAFIESNETKITSPEVSIIGNVHIDGDLSITGFSIASNHISDGISGAGHIHEEHDGPMTGAPQ